MDTRIIKDEAKQALVGNRLMMILIFIVFAAINAALGRVYVGFLILPLFVAGYYLINKILLLEHKIEFDKLFYFFRDLNHALKLLGVYLITMIIVALGFILLIVPGIIFALQYSQALYIMADNPQKDILEALKDSKELMNGHKTELFVFCLSFIGHLLLGIITLGIYLFYIAPYITSSLHNYYIHLTHQNEL